jgi:hypothetical protein
VTQESGIKNKGRGICFDEKGRIMISSEDEGIRRGGEMTLESVLDSG